uniref:RNA exonuclease 4 n=1 Tax=Kalanchoe fedtschenkoi TaxID=63787 RepID=A0A7N0RBW2_KALFE
MVGQKKNKLNPNPNWALLQEKLKIDAANTRKPEKSLLGKRKERLDPEVAQNLSFNPLTPTSTDCSVTDALAMDCEMVGVGGNRSALGRVTLVNEWGNVVYDEYVRPIEHVVDYRTEISGIRHHHLKKAKTFQVAQKKVVEMLKGRILVGHALRNDLKALLLSHPKKDIRDTSGYHPFLKDGRKRALRHLAEELLGAKIQNGEHCSVSPLFIHTNRRCSGCDATLSEK